jgi:hypothetical protein
MKKIFFGITAIAVLIGFASTFISCGNNSPSSPAATATPTPSAPTATPTPTPIPVVFIYGASSAIAGNFQTLLNSNGYNVTTTTIAGASGLAMSNYAVILISDDSGNTTVWGNTTLVNAIIASAKPVLGLGVGGAHFFDTAGAGAGCAAIGYSNSSLLSVTAITPQATTNSL